MTDHVLDAVLIFFVAATIFFSIEIVCEHVFAEVNSNTTTAQVYVNTTNMPVPQDVVFQSPHTLIIKGDLQTLSEPLTIPPWDDIDTAKAQGYKITSVSINSYVATPPGYENLPQLHESVLIVMEK